jgi:hypothetical protein
MIGGKSGLRSSDMPMIFLSAHAEMLAELAVGASASLRERAIG